MNDRFKFRVWFENQKKYTNKMYLRQDGIVAWNGTSLPAMIGEYIIEQCTGLKDKNGKLIYEGDIIHEVDKDADIDDVSQIVWDQDTCNFMKLDLPETGLDRHCILCEDDSPYIEIIGNIHKQPEQKDK